MTLNWIKSRAVTIGVELEPKLLVSRASDEPGWATLDATPSIELSHGNWLDATGELLIARTRQTDHLVTTEVTPRIGFRFHLLSNLFDDLAKEKQPKRRVVLRDYLRTEWRNLSYSDATPPSSTVRVRDRIETQFPVNRPRVTDDGAVYVSSDVEWFWSRVDVEERFANKQRIRAGFGYRRSYAWRVETLYIRDRSRDSAAGGFSNAGNAVDVRVRHVW